MINNRQNGRRRGRGGQQPRNGQPGNNDRGNRIDNRARGNAAQLLEKYKNLARDAQMQGDRVNTEYYLQFADHYFRVLSESRARFEEQRPNDQQRSRRDEGDDFSQDGDFEVADQRFTQGDQWNDSEDERPQPQQVDNRRQRYETNNESEGEAAPAQAQAPQPYEGERRPRRERAPRANGYNGNNGNANVARDQAEEPVSERIEIDRLPQSLSVAPSNDVDEAPAAEETPRRRRAPRRPRAESAEA